MKITWIELEIMREIQHQVLGNTTISHKTLPPNILVVGIYASLTLTSQQL